MGQRSSLVILTITEGRNDAIKAIRTINLRWILKLELLELKISFNRPTYDVLYQRRVYEVSSNKCVRCNEEVETCVLFDLWKEAVNVFIENGDERRQYYDLITLKSRLFPLENLLYEITHGIINFKIWKYKHLVDFEKSQAQYRPYERPPFTSPGGPLT
ncbi:hypothetical protein RIR_jg22083.t1 [Rhizophagus irregularis DAOM 181602=DAOM 197198]|nr:hypothetical protein RIR_jg22083.t1 [Rhizophagus irregularis DAOM 181602=DAOM 197198]